VTTGWVKARRSTDNNACVEMRRTPEDVQVRDTKQHGSGPTLQLRPIAFAAWLAGAKSGAFDDLIE
jgi:hypothetical protein